MKKVWSLLLAGAMLLSLAACGSSGGSAAGSGSGSGSGDTSAAEPVELTVFAAASMTETLNAIAEQYKTVAPNVTLTFNFDSSGTLLDQIEAGAVCDLFISAAPKQMNALDG